LLATVHKSKHPQRQDLLRLQQSAGMH
jgi:hypothetical protein